jgi:hypothetical protein
MYALPNTVTGKKWAKQYNFGQFSSLGKTNKAELNSRVQTQPFNAAVTAAVDAQKARKLVVKGPKYFPKAYEWMKEAQRQEQFAALNANPEDRVLLNTTAGNMALVADKLSKPYGTDALSRQNLRNTSYQSTRVKNMSTDNARKIGANITNTNFRTTSDYPAFQLDNFSGGGLKGGFLNWMFEK